MIQLEPIYVVKFSFLSCFVNCFCVSFSPFTNLRHFQSDGDVADGDVFESTRMESGARGERDIKTIQKPEIYSDSENVRDLLSPLYVRELYKLLVMNSDTRDNYMCDITSQSTPTVAIFMSPNCFFFCFSTTTTSLSILG